MDLSRRGITCAVESNRAISTEILKRAGANTKISKDASSFGLITDLVTNSSTDANSPITAVDSGNPLIETVLFASMNAAIISLKNVISA